MGPADSHRITRVPRYSGYRYQCNRLRVQAFHLLRNNFPDISARLSHRISRSYYPDVALTHNVGLGSSPFARHYLGNHCCFLFLRVLRCFSSPRSPRVTYTRYRSRGGLPHSEIHGSQVNCTSPWLIAAFRVLHRLREPRHPPCALTYFLAYSQRTPLCGAYDAEHTFGSPATLR